MKITFHQWEVKVCFKTLVSPPAPPFSSLCVVVQEANVRPSRAAGGKPTAAGGETDRRQLFKKVMRQISSCATITLFTQVTVKHVSDYQNNRF